MAGIALALTDNVYASAVCSGAGDGSAGRVNLWSWVVCAYKYYNMSTLRTGYDGADSAAGH